MFSHDDRKLQGNVKMVKCAFLVETFSWLNAQEMQFDVILTLGEESISNLFDRKSVESNLHSIITKEDKIYLVGKFGIGAGPLDLDRTVCTKALTFDDLLNFCKQHLQKEVSIVINEEEGVFHAITFGDKCIKLNGWLKNADKKG